MRLSQLSGDSRVISALAAVLVVGLVWPAAASSFDEAMNIRAKGNSSSQNSQKRIDRLSEDTDMMLTEYRSTLSQIDALRVYNRQVEGLIAAQEEEIASLQGPEGNLT